MLRIVCPYCGERDHVEYLYGGDATRSMPDLADADLDRWCDWVFVRDNPKGEHCEYWQHVHGCRQWLRVVRDTVTHAIREVSPAREPAGASGGRRSWVN